MDLKTLSIFIWLYVSVGGVTLLLRAFLENPYDSEEVRNKYTIRIVIFWPLFCLIWAFRLVKNPSFLKDLKVFFEATWDCIKRHW